MVLFGMMGLVGYGIYHMSPGGWPGEQNKTKKVENVVLQPADQ